MSDKRAFSKHINTHAVQCNGCKKVFSCHKNLQNHSKLCVQKNIVNINKKHHDNRLETCDICNVVVKKQFIANHKRSDLHVAKCLKKFDDKCSVYQSALKGRLIIYRMKNGSNDIENNINVHAFLLSLSQCFKEVLAIELSRKINLKFRITGVGMFSKPDLDDENYEETKKHFASSYRHLCNAEDIEEYFIEAAEEVATKSTEFNDLYSGWSIIKFVYAQLEIAKIDLCGNGGSYISLPPKILRKHACVNIKNFNDDKCFIYSFLCGYFFNVIPKNSRVYPQTYNNYIKLFNTSTIQYPISLQQIKSFEKLNAEKNFSLNIFILNKLTVEGPIYKSKVEKEKHINLLLIEENEKSHYVLVTNLSKLISSQINENSKRKFFCNGCLSFFARGDQLEFHRQSLCGEVKAKLPTKKPYIEFSNYSAKHIHPFVFISDWECILVKSPISQPIANTTRTQTHVPCSFAYKIKTTVNDPYFDNIRLYRGEDCTDVYVDYMKKDVEYIHQHYFSKIAPMELITDEIRLRLDAQTSCIICENLFSSDDVRVVDHDHFTGCIVGMSHSSCNLRVIAPKNVIVYHHGSSGYDNHIVLLAFAKRKIGKITCIPKSTENFIGFSVFLETSNNKTVEVRYLDSYRLLGQSLSALSDTLSSCPEYNEYHETHFPNQTFWHDHKKQFYCYSYFDSFDRFRETEFPPIEEFYESLTNTNISLENYNHAKEVYNALPVKNLGNYSDYYLIVDILLLYSILDNFRKTCMKNFGLDLAYSWTAPGYSFECCLNTIKMPISLCTDISMVQLISRNVRGGYTSVMKRYNSSNNKYMREGFNPEKSEKPVYNVFFDCVGMYTHVMSSFKLAYADYEWLEGDEFEYVKNNFLDISPESEFGYLLLVSLSYPPELMKNHNGMPFFPHSMTIGKTKKLVTTFYDRENYLSHYLVLAQGIRAGVKLEKVTAIIKYRQSYWLKSYITKCADLRKHSANVFEKNVYKLLCNSIFGKFLQNCLDHRDIKLVTNWKNRTKKTDAMKSLRNPKFRSFTIHNEDLVSIELQKSSVYYNRPSNSVGNLQAHFI